MVQVPIDDRRTRFVHGGNETATAFNEAPPSRAITDFITGAKGLIETITVEPGLASPAWPTIYFLVGWWGCASDYLETMHFFSRLGFRTRSFSWRGTGRSRGWSFWGFGLEDELLRVLRHFQDERRVFISHSGAIDPLRHAFGILHEEDRRSNEQSRGHKGHKALAEAAIFIAPLSRSGTMAALMRWLRPDRSGTNLTRWLRFLGSNLFGLAWFMRNELALRRVLLSDRAPVQVVERVRAQIGPCPYGCYFRSLWRFPQFLQYKAQPLDNFGVKHSLLLHAELDRNFSPRQQRETAQALGAEFGILSGTCHQWFAEPVSFQRTVTTVFEWMQRKEILPTDGEFMPRVRESLWNRWIQPPFSEEAGAQLLEEPLARQ